MIARFIAGLGSAGAVVAVSILGPGQFGYPYMGMLAGIGESLRVIHAEAPLLMFVLPLLAIAIMIVFASLILSTLAVLGVRAFLHTPKSFMKRAELWCPLLLSVTMLTGLILLRVFPGQQEVPVEFQNSHFVYPVLLALLAICVRLLDQQAERGSPANEDPMARRNASASVPPPLPRR